IAAVILAFARGVGQLGWALVAVGLLYVGVVVYVVVQRRGRSSAGGALWAGMGSFRVGDMRRAGIFSDVVVKGENRLRHWTGGLGAVAGRLEIRDDQLAWRTGRLAWMLGVRGRIGIPWSEVDGVEVADLPQSVSLV